MFEYILFLVFMVGIIDPISSLCSQLQDESIAFMNRN